MTPTDAARLLAEVAGAGHCSNPVRISGLRVDPETGELSTVDLRVACKDRRAVVCPSCAYLYKADAWVLVSAGLAGGKGVDDGVRDHARLFVTLTAPSFGPVHRRQASGACRPRATPPTCRHGAPLGCDALHEEEDDRLGAPLCPACFDYRGAVLWNATASELWHRTVVRLRQRLAASQGLAPRAFRSLCCVAYLKVAEVQRRGLVHFHSIIRADGPDGPASRAPEWLTTETLGVHVLELVQSVAVRGPLGTPVRWGSQAAVGGVEDVGEGGHAVASYVAKYATKTTDGTLALARPFRSRRAIEHVTLSPHLRQLVLTAWDLGGDPRLKERRLREHAHSLGFAGQLVTKSRSYSTTFASLRAARARHQSGDDDPELVVGTFGYAGRGYSDPRGEGVAELLHSQALELRAERAQAARDSREHSREDSRDGSRSAREP